MSASLNAASDTVLADRTARRRPPGTVAAAVALTTLVTAFGAYGAVYFTGLEGFTDLGLTFLVAYEFITLFGLVSAVALARRSALGRAGVITYGVWMAVFTAFKVGYTHEVEAIPFAVVGLAVLALAFTPSARRYVDGD